MLENKEEGIVAYLSKKLAILNQRNTPRSFI